MPELHDRMNQWYDEHARVLPWRGPEVSAWGVMVSEFMLQQTPVSRVLPVYDQWLRTWPTPKALAEASTGDAVRAWGRLGYPRRALWLHAAATTIVAEHGGQVPADYAALRTLPGVGDYTAAAVASFAYGERHVVLDTNVRRVLGRVIRGEERPAVTLTRAERETAADLLPAEGAAAAAWSVAVMELGALVCTSRAPNCGGCPVIDLCTWVRAGRPPYDGPPRRGQTYAGTDRQCRGRQLDVLREADGPVHRSRLEAAWADEIQRRRCLTSLLDDGLVAQLSGDTFALP